MDRGNDPVQPCGQRRKRSVAVVAIAAVIAACSSSSGAPSGPCAKRVGTYRLSFATRSGSCGTLSEQIVTLTEQPMAVADPCTGSIQYSSDNCTATSDATCPSNDGTAVEQRETVHWNQDGSRGSGEVQYILHDVATGNTLCTGTYDVAADRI